MDKPLKELKDELRTTILEMSDKQLEDYFNAALQINKFAEEMKKRFAQKILEGREGWSDNQYNIITEIDSRLERLERGDLAVDIGIANWAFIHWFNRTKEKPMVLPANDEQVRQVLERLINATPTGEVRNALCDANIKLLQIAEKKENEISE